VPDAEFAGLGALVTGGASGIGLATARLLAARGAGVACLDVTPATPEPPLEQVRADRADDAAVRAAVGEAAQRLGGLDIVVNNAGVGAAGTIEANPDREWHQVFDINVLGIVRVTRAALPFLRASANAVVVNTCSVAASVGLPNRALYSATKGAVQSLTLAMAADHLPEGIRVCCVNPGTADTPWVRRLLAAAPTPRPSSRPWPPASPPAGWSPRRRSPPPSRTWPARWPGPPPALCWPSTAACTAFASRPRPAPDGGAGPPGHQEAKMRAWPPEPCS
jgi:2-keto-3-deoxy-L-fuconate dehydrogenase